MSLMFSYQLVLHRWVIKFFVWHLCRQLGIKRYVISGSYRRGKWFCNDIDLVIPIDSERQANGILASLKKIGWTPLRETNEFSHFFGSQFYKKILDKVLILDVFFSYPGHMGNTLLFTTGPKSFNDKIRYNIGSLGYSWSNPRFFRNIETEEEVVFDSEKAALNFINLKWIKPSKRN